MSESNNAEKIADSFRRWGYLQANLDIFGRLAPSPHRDLDEASGKEADKFRAIYCDKIGAEFMHIPFPERADWIAQRMENLETNLEDKFIFERIMKAELFEKFIHTRYVGNKRFSLDGLAMMIPLMDSILEQAGQLGFTTVMIGMSHRGRLNTMVHTVGTKPMNIFAGFEDVDPRSVLGSGDVKYHKGATGPYITQAGKTINIHLASNPSHLEAINPVLMGRTRARQRRIGDRRGRKVLAVLLHGDAAFAGQGINAESLNFMGIDGFDIGGTVHIVVNNLVGFTAKPKALYGQKFCTNIARRLPVPIFHVNGECPKEVIKTGAMAMDYRSKFKTDVVIDLIGYRRYGHSEIDDPTLTQPVLYEQIVSHPLLYQRFGQEIGLTEDQIKTDEHSYIAALDEALERGRKIEKQPSLAQLPEHWDNYTGEFYSPEFETDTSVAEEVIEKIGKCVSTLPEGFNQHRKLAKGFNEREKMAMGEKPIDWGMAEQLAFGSLLWESVPVRLVGQDSRRGTFNHRQAVSFDIESAEEYIPLRNLHPDQGTFDVFDSMLSEAAALGFEYGYSREFPDGLVLWEAQFGDFANGAQIIFDQFISAAEDKWHLLSGVVMLLPHGYEGQGPEHSSARVERFLQLCAEDNMQVVYPSTAAQYFHVLRRQVLRRWRKPLVVFTPKSMLRNPAAACPREQFTDGGFKNVLDDHPGFEEAQRIIFCTGKVAHELRKERERKGTTDVAVVTLEQLYPFPEQEIKDLISRYENCESITWVQEEPSNMGALFFVRPLLERLAGGRPVSTVRRSESASPSTGSPKAHALEQQAILKMAFAKHSTAAS